MRVQTEASRLFSRAVGSIAFAVAALGLIVLLGGWQLDVPALRTVIPGAVAMKWLTATGFVAAGVSLWGLLDPLASRRRRRLGQAAALLVGALGLAVTAEYVLGVDLGIDELFYPDHASRALGIAYPGRPSPVTGANFIVLSAALTALQPRFSRWRAAEVLSVPVLLTGAMSLVGYAYSIPAFYGPASAAKMAVHTAAAFVALGIGLLLARPSGRIVALLRTTDPGGVTFRRLGPIAIGLPLVMGWVAVRLVDHDVMSRTVSTWWTSALTAGVLGAVVWGLARSLSRADATRRELERELAVLATSDTLTGLANRRSFEEALAVQVARAERDHESGVLLVFDLDNFKGVNDAGGHLAGDQILFEIAVAVAGRVRRADVAARIGGDEFAVILPHADVAGGIVLATALLDAVRELLNEVTLSIGIAPIAGPDALRLADEAMYAAKRAGGDGLLVAELRSPV